MPDSGTCRGCNEPIQWVITKNKKRAPMNLDGTPHFATCPKAGEFRKRDQLPLL